MAAKSARHLLITSAASVIALAACAGSGRSGPDATSAAPAPAQASAAALGATGGPAAPMSSATTGNASTRPTSSSSSGPAAPYPTPPAGRVPVPRRDQSSVLAALPGRATQTCVVVGSGTNVRSGGIAAGNFAQARRSYAQQVPITEVPMVFVYLIPQHAESLTSATVRIANLASGATQTVTSSSVEQADQWRYFAVQLPIPSPGTYRLIMSAGADHGCIEVRFTR